MSIAHRGEHSNDAPAGFCRSSPSLRSRAAGRTDSASVSRGEPESQQRRGGNRSVRRAIRWCGPSARRVRPVCSSRPRRDRAPAATVWAPCQTWGCPSARWWRCRSTAGPWTPSAACVPDSSRPGKSRSERRIAIHVNGMIPTRRNWCKRTGCFGCASGTSRRLVLISLSLVG